MRFTISRKDKILFFALAPVWFPFALVGAILYGVFVGGQSVGRKLSQPTVAAQRKDKQKAEKSASQRELDTSAKDGTLKKEMRKLLLQSDSNANKDAFVHQDMTYVHYFLGQNRELNELNRTMRNKDRALIRNFLGEYHEAIREWSLVPEQHRWVLHVLVVFCLFF
jgi:hypothetical protein